MTSNESSSAFACRTTADILLILRFPLWDVNNGQARTLYNFPALNRIVKQPCLLDSDRVLSCRMATVCQHLKHMTRYQRQLFRYFGHQVHQPLFSGCCRSEPRKLRGGEVQLAFCYVAPSLHSRP